MRRDEARETITITVELPIETGVPACGYRPEDTTDDDVETAGEYFDAHASAEVLLAMDWDIRIDPQQIREAARVVAMPVRNDDGVETHEVDTQRVNCCARICRHLAGSSATAG